MARRVNKFFPEFSAIFPKRKNGIESFPIPFPKIGVLFRDQREGIVVGPVREGEMSRPGSDMPNGTQPAFPPYWLHDNPLPLIPK